MIVSGHDNRVPFVYLLNDGTGKILNRDEDVTIGGNLDRVNQYFDFDQNVDDLLLFVIR